MDATAVFLVIVAVIVVIAAVFSIRKGNAQRAQDTAEHVISRLKLPGALAAAPLRFTATELIEGYAEGAPRHPLAGITARVEDSGTLNRRITATRLVAFGVFALAAPKKQDDREVYLTIEGPSTAILRAVSLKNGGTVVSTAVRKFAMELNAASRALGTTKDAPAELE